MTSGMKQFIISPNSTLLAGRGQCGRAMAGGATMAKGG